LSDEEEAERRPIWVLDDISSDDPEFVEQIEIQDHVPLKHRTPRESARGVRGQDHRSTPLAGDCHLQAPSSPSRGHH
jgi:hypothetical protein